MGDEHQRCDQYEYTKGKMSPRDQYAGLDARPTPNPALSGGGTNTKIARQQDAMGRPMNSRNASQFQGK